MKTNAKVKQLENNEVLCASKKVLLCLLQRCMVFFKSMFSFIEDQIVLLRGDVHSARGRNPLLVKADAFPQVGSDI